MTETTVKEISPKVWKVLSTKIFQGLLGVEKHKCRNTLGKRDHIRLESLNEDYLIQFSIPYTEDVTSIISTHKTERT